jgi:hypothetical protein
VRGPFRGGLLAADCAERTRGRCIRSLERARNSLQSRQSCPPHSARSPGFLIEPSAVFTRGRQLVVQFGD